MKGIENELIKLNRAVPENENDFEDKKSYMKEELSKGSSEFGNRMGSYRSNPLRENISGQRATIANICEEGKISSVIGPIGLQKILQLLTSEDSDVQVHAVKVVANLTAEGALHLPELLQYPLAYLESPLDLLVLWQISDSDLDTPPQDGLMVDEY
uniref:Uncharacterized protein n=1 Tax=Quercus lobata TaxID=97700 RepID=A0A7N2MDC3_QUELO